MTQVHKWRNLSDEQLLVLIEIDLKRIIKEKKLSEREDTIKVNGKLPTIRFYEKYYSHRESPCYSTIHSRFKNWKRVVYLIERKLELEREAQNKILLEEKVNG